MKILFFSDTHGKHGDVIIPEGVDMAIFGGDAGTYRNPIMNKDSVLSFIEWYGSLTHPKYKIWVAGNHDTSIEAGLVNAKALSESKGLIYLEHEACEVEGIKIFGSPYTPTFGHDWAFNVNRGEAIANKWRDFPEGLDIIITHGPPYGILDYTIGRVRAGCEDLYKQIFISKPKIHIFGHIHEGYGVRRIDDVMFLNASVLDMEYNYSNELFIIDTETWELI